MVKKNEVKGEIPTITNSSASTAVNAKMNEVRKIDFDDKLKNLNTKVTSNKTKHVLVENEFKKLQTFGTTFFVGQSYFNNNGVQIHLIFKSLYYTLKRKNCIMEI